MAKVAKRAKIPRESLYRMLSPKDNPRWSTLAPVVRATGELNMDKQDGRDEEGITTDYTDGHGCTNGGWRRAKARELRIRNDGVGE